MRRPLNCGPVSSKADIFEAKVASAVDEANSSDSDETFVYESNPPESRRAQVDHYHSRTPSTTSLASHLDGYGARIKQVRDVSHGVVSKRSMKFTNNAYDDSVDGDNGHSGSARGSIRNGSITPRHHHIGRYGRGGHASLFDSDSPFTQANKSSSPRAPLSNVAKLSGPGSPRGADGKRITGGARKTELSTYDVDDDGADDERTPLVSSVRIYRNRHSRRPAHGASRHLDYLDDQPPGFCTRYGVYVMTTMFLLLLLGVGTGTFVTALNKPLTDVSVRHIQNVLASEQEIMLDLDVRATNPNLFAITVTNLDVNMFAKSGSVGTSAHWREHQAHLLSPRMNRRHALIEGRRSLDGIGTEESFGGVDEGTDPVDDPINDPDGDSQTMLLGRVFHFDSPLVFEPSPLQRASTSYVGEIRLAKPGNETEEGGSARWERVLQHPFELIVRGVIKYQLPITSSRRSAALGSRIKVYPKEGSGDPESGPA